MEAYKQEKFEVMQRARAYGSTRCHGAEAMSKTISDINDAMLNRQADRIKELEREVADALDCRSGTGPTALSMVLAERDQLREHVKMLRDELNTVYKLVPDLVVLMEPSALAATEPTSIPTDT